MTSLLKVESQDFEVVITNNCSTDSTLQMLNGIKDDRLVVYNNQTPEPAYYNMIVSIFNARGKYALYCNDRDVLFTERLLSFIDFLKDHDYSYLHIAKCYGNPSFKLEEYEKGFDSLMHHPYSQHPTGMVYNVQLMQKYLSREDYKKYVIDVYTWCFLCRDLVIYGKTAQYDNYLWDERPSIFKVQSASGAVYKGQLFFDTEKIIDYMKSVVGHVIGNPYFSLSFEEELYLVINIFNFYCHRLMSKKYYYADKRECAHYGIKPRHVSYFEMRRTYYQYFKECENTLMTTPYYEILIEKWNLQKKVFLRSLFMDCLRCDRTVLSKTIRRALNPDYRY